MIFHEDLSGLIEGASTYRERIESGFFQSYMSGGVVLDIGYKGGNENAVPIFKDAIGVDLDYPGYNGRVLPFNDNYADTIFSSHVLEHISDYCGAFMEWLRVVKVNGYIVIIVPHMHLYERKNYPPSRHNMDHKRFYTPARLLREIEESIDIARYQVVHLRENRNK